MAELVIATAMAGKVVEKNTEMVINGVIVKQFSYVFCFRSNLHNFQKEAEKLKDAQGRTQHAVERAQRNGEDIEQDVRKWLADAQDVLDWKQSTETEINETQGCFLSKNFKYRLSRNLKKKTVLVKDLISNTPSGSVGRLVQPPPLEFSGVKPNLSDSSKLAFNHIIDALQNDKVQMIGLYGMGGVGKTTLVERIGQEVKDKNLFDNALMVVFSKTPDIKKMQDKMAGELGLKFDDENDETLRASRLLSRLKQETSILIILDDVWKEFKLTDIGIEIDASQTKCKYIVTTRDMHVCETMSCQEKVELKIMTESETWALFKEKADLDDDSPVADIAKKVAKKCDGLPIAIVTLASALKKNTDEQWKAALKKLNNFELIDINNIDEKKNAYMCFQSSYDELKDDLKRCLLLCSLCPEDSEISKEDLVQLAGTEFKRRGNFEDKRNLVGSCIDTLLDKCLLIKSGDEKKHEVKVHDMIRDFSLWMLSKPDSIFTGTYVDVSSDPPTMDMLAASMIIFILLKQNIILPSGTSYEKLRVLLVAGHKWESISNAVLEGMTNLRSLSLVYCTHLDDMPSLRGLMNLEILSFGNSEDITQLPDGISEMQHLKLLDLSFCPKLMKVPDDLLKQLLSLEELYTHGSDQLWGEERSNLKVSELKALQRLKRLSLELEYTSLPKGFVFPKLKWYYIHISSKQYFITDPDLKLSDITNTLKFENVESTGKNVFGNLLPRVNDLEVEDRSGEIECITPYMHQEGFNKLEVLEVSHSDGLKCLVNTAEVKDHSPVFLKLAKLKLQSLPELRCLWQGPTPDAGFKNLTDVSIVDCQSLTFVFSESLAQSLIRLQRLKVERCPVLEHIIKEEDEIAISLNHNQTGCFGKLEGLYITKCPKLKYIMSIAIAQRLERLESLEIYGNSGLVQIFGPEEEEGGSSGDIVLPLVAELRYDKPDHINGIWSPSLKDLIIREEEESGINRLLNGKQLDHLGVLEKAETWYTVLAMLVKQRHFNLKEISLYRIEELDQMFHMEGVGNEEPLSLVSIESLTLYNLPDLRDIWSGCIYTPNLTTLRILRCNSLRSIFSPTLARNLPLLKKLKIQDCDELEAIIGEDNHGESDHPNPTYFPNLTKLTILICHSLRSIFSPTSARNLPLLQKLAILDCSKLEAIIGEDNHGESDHPNPTFFPNLEKIYIWNCRKLKYIFPVSVAVGGLSKLSTLDVRYCDEVEGVFEGEKAVNDTKIILPLLRSLKLDTLPNLKSFSPVGYHFIYVTKCDKVATRFSIDSDGSVHAESKDNSKMLGPGYDVVKTEELPQYAG